MQVRRSSCLLVKKVYLNSHGSGCTSITYVYRKKKNLLVLCLNRHFHDRVFSFAGAELFQSWFCIKFGIQHYELSLIYQTRI